MALEFAQIAGKERALSRNEVLLSIMGSKTVTQLENNEMGVRPVIISFAAVIGVMLFGALAVAEGTDPNKPARPEEGNDPEKIIEFLLSHHYEIRAVLQTTDPEVFRLLLQYQADLVICQVTHEPGRDQWKDGHQCARIQ